MAQGHGGDNPPTLPIAQGRKPRGPSADNLDLVQMGLEALKRVGGVDYLEEQARKRPKDFLAFLCRLAPLQIKADISNLEIVVHALTVDPQPTPGVIASPVADNVIRLVHDRARELAREANTQLQQPGDDDAPA